MVGISILNTFGKKREGRTQNDRAKQKTGSKTEYEIRHKRIGKQTFEQACK